MRIVAALGGNAILRRGEPMTVDNQRTSIAEACAPLARIANEHQLVISHGNGPQIGLLALQAAAYDAISTYPFDVLGAQTEGMIGYLIEQELGNRLHNRREIATLVTRTVVDDADPAFARPTKPVGPMYDARQAERLGLERGWTIRKDGEGYRRVVPSPRPQRILEIAPVEWILDRGGIVICAGGGGIPTTYDEKSQSVSGIEAVIDKDHASAVLAIGLKADVLIVATDVDGVIDGWGSADQRVIARANPGALDPRDYAEGSMGPKVAAAVRFASSGSGDAVIGSLRDIDGMLAGTAGTRVTSQEAGIVYRDGLPIGDRVES